MSTSTDTSSVLPLGAAGQGQQQSGTVLHSSGAGDPCRVHCAEETAPLRTMGEWNVREVGLDSAHLSRRVVRVRFHASMFCEVGRTMVAMEAVTVEPGVRVIR